MLYVWTSNHPMPVMAWHVGTRFDVPPALITALQADGDELEYVRAVMVGHLPTHEGAVVKFGTATAQRIARHLLEDYGPEGIKVSA